MPRTRVWLLLALCALVSLALVAYPLVIVQPFQHQNEGDLLRALAVFRIAPALTVLLAAIGLGAVAWSWKALSTRARAGSALLLVLLGAFAVASRINVFEQMFHPAGTPQFLTADKAALAPDDMLITVVVNQDSHAYPIREMGYHHVVNDWVGATPIVATY